MARATYYCRACARFVSGPLSRCNSCGNEHGRDYRAQEEPPHLRRKALPKRDGWEHLFR